jgi:hypothetical protein
VRPVSQTGATVTLAWKPQNGAAGYVFIRDGIVLSRTFDRATRRATFWQGTRYSVGVLYRKKNGRVIRGKLASFTPPGTNRPVDRAVSGGRVVTLTGTYTPEAFSAAVSATPAGPVTIAGTYTVTGDVDVRRAGLRIAGATVEGVVHFQPTADGSALIDSTAMGFDIFGADNVLIQGNRLDGRGIVFQNDIWDVHGDTPDGWVIRNNSFSNYVHDDDHSEALFIGYSTDGLVEHNTFTNNGITSHIFFSWWGDVADPATSYPRSICVRDNTFNKTAGAYFDINFRAEVPTSANIKIQRNATASSVDHRFYGKC